MYYIGTANCYKHLDADLSGTLVDQTKYRSMVGALMYLTASRPDIVHATCYCARYQAKPTEKHLTAVKRIFRYLKTHIKTVVLWYPKDTGSIKPAFQSDHMRFLINVRVHLLGHTISRRDKLMSAVIQKSRTATTMSSAEAEYVSLSACCAQVLWLRTQLTDYGFHFDKIPMYCDSQAAIAISCNPVQHSRTSTSMQYHFKRNRAQVDQGSQIKMIQVKEMMQDNDLKNSKSKDKGSKSRSQSMNEQSRYKQDKTKTRQSINVKSHIFNVKGDNDKSKQTPTRMSSVMLLSVRSKSIINTLFPLKKVVLLWGMRMVAELAQTKQTYGIALTKLIKKVKKLEQSVKSTQARRRFRIVVSDNEEVLEDPSKQGRKITEIDQDPSISLPTELVEDQGSGENGEKEVSTVGAEHSTVIPEVSTAAENLENSNEPEKKTRETREERLGLDEAVGYYGSNSIFASHGILKKKKGSEKKGSRKKSLARKRAGEKQSEESTKRQKIEDDIEKEELKAYLDLVPREEFAMEIESLGTKYPIVDWKTHIAKTLVLSIIRADESSKNYKIFSEMLDDFDRQDVINLHRLSRRKVINIKTRLTALIDKKKVIITETSIKSDLHLEDAGGTDCLPTATIFEETGYDELGDMSHHKKIYVNPSHIKKIFVNMRREGKDFSGRIPITTQPSSSRSQKKQSRRKQRKDTAVLDLEKAKDAQAKGIADLKKRVQKLERQKKSRTTGLKRLQKVGMSRRVKSSEDKGRLDNEAMFDTNNLHGDEVNVDMPVGEKSEQSAKEREVDTSVEDSVAPTTIEEITLAQTLIQINAAKPKLVTTAATTTTTTRPKARGVVVQEPSEFRTP
ncbi:hypothetical protein Tco_0232703 [Tanacetum coccineum]